jgi:hypothetical protein
VGFPRVIAIAIVIALAATSACSYQTVEIGHRGLRFDPRDASGLRREILPEGRYLIGHFCGLHACGRIVDFDVTYTSTAEAITTTSKDNLTLDASVSIVYRPIVNELYELATEGSPTAYYRKIVQPEIRSVANAVLARYAWTELRTEREKIENEIEVDVRRRVRGKHVEVSAITIDVMQPR